MPALLLIPAVIVVVMLVFGVIAGLSGNKPAPKPPRREPPAAEHSCVVKGILRSLAEEPEWWEIRYLKHGAPFAEHTWNGINVSCNCMPHIHWQMIQEVPEITGMSQYHGFVESKPVTPSEAKALYQAIEALQEQRNRKIFAKHDEVRQTKLARFERMGCPESAA